MGVQTSFGAPPRPEPASRLRGIAEDAADWCRGKSIWWRLPILCWIAWTGVRFWRDPEASSLLIGITFAIHELGHLLTSGLGVFVSVASGSLFQLAAPAAAGLIFGRQRDYFAVAFAGGWLAVSLWNLSVYVADARAKALPLLGFSDDPIHDWNYLLGKLGLLAWDARLAAAIRLGATALWLASVLFGAWLLWRMATDRRRVNSAGRPPASP